MKTPETQIFFDSPEAASYQTGLSGWVSRGGWFFGDGPQSEEIARYDGCTHVACKTCGTPTEKLWTKCKTCRSQDDLLRYEAKPSAEWNGESVLYSETLGVFYDSPEQAREDLGEGKPLSALRLVICQPVYTTPLDLDYWDNEVPDNWEIPNEVYQAMRAFNAAVDGIVIAWEPGEYRLGADYEQS